MAQCSHCPGHRLQARPCRCCSECGGSASRLYCCSWYSKASCHCQPICGALQRAKTSFPARPGWLLAGGTGFMYRQSNLQCQLLVRHSGMLRMLSMLSMLSMFKEVRCGRVRQISRTSYPCGSSTLLNKAVLIANGGPAGWSPIGKIMVTSSPPGLSSRFMA